MLSETMITAYLERIGCADARTPSRENLFRLQRAHLATVPYTNLTIRITGKEPDLATDALFDRIVTRKMGGYCFELNGLFAKLLRALGYGVTKSIWSVTYSTKADAHLTASTEITGLTGF